MIVEGRARKSIWINYKYYGECLDNEGLFWTWVTNSDVQVINMQKKNRVMGMKLLSINENKLFYISKRFED